MANVTVKAQFMLSDGTLVSMSGTLAEGTASELQTSTTYSAAATSIQNLQPKANSMGGYAVNLNFIARVTTSS